VILFMPMTLTDCYVPLSIYPSRNNELRSFDPDNRPSGDGITTRNARSMRRICMDISLLSRSTGSCLVECGHTKVIATVHAPRPVVSSCLNSGSLEYISGGLLNCQVRFAPNFGMRQETKVMSMYSNLDGYTPSANLNRQVTEKEMYLSACLRDTISTCIPFEQLQKSVVDLFVLVIQDDGCAFSTCVTAACLSLVDAGFDLYDLVSSCSVAVLTKNLDNTNEDNTPMETMYHLLVDPSEEEILLSEGIYTLSMLGNWKEVSFWDQRGRLPEHVTLDAKELCRYGCYSIHKFMRRCLITKLNISP